MKFPEEAFEYLEQHGLVSKIIKYVINRHNYRDSVWLKPWMETQVEEAATHTDAVNIAKAAIKAIPDKKDYDRVVTGVLSWVARNITYKGDIETQKTAEYWQRYNETLDSREGDCEDGAILIYVLCRLAGVPANRLLLLAGNVEGGGHCYLAYKPSYNPSELIFLDWCYWYDKRRTGDRPSFYVSGNEIKESIFNPVKGDYRIDKYHTMWWAFNENGTYSKMVPTTGGM